MSGLPPQQRSQESLLLAAERVLAHRRVELVLAARALQQQVEREHGHIPPVNARQQQPIDQCRHRIAVHVASLRTVPHGQVGGHLPRVHQFEPQRPYAFAPALGGKMVDGLDVAQHLARESGMSGVSGISGISGVSGNKHSSFSCQLFQAVSVEFLGLEFSKTCFLHFSKFCEKAEVMHLSAATTLTQLGLMNWVNF